MQTPTITYPQPASTSLLRAFCANSAFPKGWGYSLVQGTLIARGGVNQASCHTSIVRSRSKHGTARVEMEATEVLENWSDIEEDSESEMSESDEDESENEDEEADCESENWRDITGTYTK